MSRFQGLTLNEFITSELGNKEEMVEVFKMDILNDAKRIIDEEGAIDLVNAKDLIWDYTNWPPYIDPGASLMMNIRDRLIENGMAKHFLISIYRELNRRNPNTYGYDKDELQIFYREK